MKDWAVILGSSRGFGAATCREIASKGINIYGIHLDRKAAMESINLLINEFMNVLSFVRDTCPEERLSYANPLPK